MDDAALLELAAGLADRAGAVILAIRARGFETLRKRDASPVTEADHAAEALILAGLRAAVPAIPVIAEEETEAGHVHETGREYWLVDPLDGTKEFAALRDEFTVNIGLMRDGQPVLGVVGVPAYGELFGGRVGAGAWKRDCAGQREIRVRQPPAEGLHVLASRSYGSDVRLQTFLEGRVVAGVVNMGSALKIVRVAEGAADLYPRFGRTMEWDTAAPQAVLEAAGGRLTELDGSHFVYGKPGWANPGFVWFRGGMTQVLAGAAGVAEAARLLLEGGLVAFGTETVYGLGADATQGRAVAAVFDAKGRPHFNPLICHYPDAAAAFAHVEASTVALRLAEAFWPGPLTMVLPRRVTCPVALLAGAGLETLAVRVPAHEGALALLQAVGRPVAAPSANRSGSVSPTTVAHVLSGLGGRIAAVLDGGACPVGVESTVLDLAAGAPCLLRPGGVTVEAIEAVIGAVGRGITPAAAEVSRTLRSPGLLVSHYAPRLPLRLSAMEVGADEGLLAFGGALRGAGAVFQLSAAGDLVEARRGCLPGCGGWMRRGAAGAARDCGDGGA